MIKVLGAAALLAALAACSAEQPASPKFIDTDPCTLLQSGDAGTLSGTPAKTERACTFTFSEATVTVTLLAAKFEQDSEPLLANGGYGAVVEDRPMTRRCADSTCEAVVDVRDGDVLGLKVVKAGEDVNVLGQTTQGLGLKATGEAAEVKRWLPLVVLLAGCTATPVVPASTTSRTPATKTVATTSPRIDTPQTLAGADPCRLLVAADFDTPLYGEPAPYPDIPRSCVFREGSGAGTDLIVLVAFADAYVRPDKSMEMLIGAGHSAATLVRHLARRDGVHDTRGGQRDRVVEGHRAPAGRQFRPGRRDLTGEGAQGVRPAAEIAVTK